MELHRLPAEEEAVRRFVEDLWLPYHRTLEATVDAHSLAADVDLVAEEVPFRLGRADRENHWTWIAVDDEGDGPVDLTDPNVELVGFVVTELAESPSVFERPGRLNVADVFVREPYRGTGVGRKLMLRAAKRARETGCGELALDVHLDNEDAIEFYEALGFEARRVRMVARVDEF